MGEKVIIGQIQYACLLVMGTGTHKCSEIAKEVGLIFRDIHPEYANEINEFLTTGHAECGWARRVRRSLRFLVNRRLLERVGIGQYTLTEELYHQELVVRKTSQLLRGTI